MSARKRGAKDAYAYADASKPCPNCGAAPYAWCHTPAGTVRAMPCVSRLQAPLDAEVEEDDTPPRPDLRLVRDPSEPLHGRDDDEGSP